MGLSYFSVTVIKHQTKEAYGREGWFGLTVSEAQEFLTIIPGKGGSRQAQPLEQAKISD